jgi:predicted TPR repeat methyltransferase
MDVRQAYNAWASQYDTNHNRTRDLEAISLRESLTPVSFERCLEIGCGTGKNTAWLTGKATHVTAVDLSDEMLAKAKEKINSDKVRFQQADITEPWSFADRLYDLLIFSLVLEHIENLHDIFKKAAGAVVRNGYVYIGELHPFKQYMGTKARFDTGAGQQVVTCYNHHVSDFTQAARENGFAIVDIKEYFDDGDKAGIPRILTLILQKQ